MARGGRGWPWKGRGMLGPGNSLTDLQQVQKWENHKTLSTHANISKEKTVIKIEWSSKLRYLKHHRRATLVSVDLLIPFSPLAKQEYG